MARIRTIKPEFFDDERVGRLSMVGRLLFIGIWTQADDYGVCRANPAFLKARIFPYDTIELSTVASALEELTKEGMIFRADNEGESLLLVKNWPQHQVINKPSRFKTLQGTYEQNLEWFENRLREHYGSTTGVLPESDGSPTGRNGRELGREGKRKGREGNEIPAESTKAQALLAGYCERFKRRWGLNPEIVGRDAGIAKRIAKTWAPDKIELYLDAFFAMPDAWLIKTKHPIPLLEQKLNEVVVFAQSGHFTTSREASQADTMATNQLLLERIRREEP